MVVEPTTSVAAPTPPHAGTERPSKARIPSHPRWYKRYLALLWAVDAASITAAIVLAYTTRFGNDLSAEVAGTPATYGSATILIGITWWTFLGLRGSRERGIAGHGLEEYRRVISSTLFAFGGIAVASFIFQVQLSRAMFLIMLPGGIILLMAGRWLLRQQLRRRRSNGRAMMSTVVVGGPQEVWDAVRDLERNRQAGYRPVAVALSSATPIPIELAQFDRTEVDTVDILVRQQGIAAVVVAGGLNRTTVRKLAWQLEGLPTELMFVPWLTDVAGPRLRVRQVQELTLTHVDLPRHSGWNHVLKRGFDIVFSSFALVILAPLLAVVALLVKLEDGGPVLFRQERVGLGGVPFKIHKFRTMHVDAERRLEALRDQSEANGPLFKMTKDPRITTVGRILRKYSLDELPQFWNVLLGTMSVVGPRPHLANELADYPNDGLRRLLIKPGITGLWQVSGRSDLSFEDSIRLDLRYVENWSLTGDITIILKTVRTVIDPKGAY